MNSETMESTLNGWLITLKRVFLAVAVAWTLLLFCLGWWAVSRVLNQATRNITMQARSFYELIVSARAWNASHGGVYVPISPTSQPNPYLQVPERDILTDDGRRLTLVNPAYMTRQMAEQFSRENKVQFRITSLNPLRPENAAEEWEAEMLKGFRPDQPEHYYWWRDERDKRQYFRYMSALWTKQECLTCHAEQGYKVGDLRGGISVTIPAEAIMADQRRNTLSALVAHVLIWLAGLAGGFVSYQLLEAGGRERDNLIERLYKSLREIKILKGIIPICASCKKIRNDEGAWQAVENYIRENSDAEFSHGICPDCCRRLYPQHFDEAGNLKKTRGFDVGSEEPGGST